MTQLSIRSEYMVVTVEYAETIIEARWHYGAGINYCVDGRDIAYATQYGLVTDSDSLSAFVLENLPYHLGIEDEETEDS
jgi:hypothetical protein